MPDNPLILSEFSEIHTISSSLYRSEATNTTISLVILASGSCLLSFFLIKTFSLPSLPTETERNAFAESVSPRAFYLVDGKPSISKFDSL